MASASTPSASTPFSCGPCEDLILIFAVTLKPIRKPHFSGEMLSIGIRPNFKIMIEYDYVLWS